MTSAKLALTAAALITIGLAGIPQVKVVGNQLKQHERLVRELQVEVQTLRDAHQGLQTAYYDLEQEQTQLERGQSSLSSLNEEAYAEQARLKNEYQDLRDAQGKLQQVQQEIRSYHQSLLSSQEILSQEQEQFMANFEQNLAALVDQDQKIQAELGNFSGLGQAIKEDLKLQMAGWVNDSQQNRLQNLREQVLTPVFQLSGGEAVGSAVLIHRQIDEEQSTYYALSCYHVVRDILEDRGELNDLSQEVVTAIFTFPSGKEVEASARMIAWDISTDLALLEVKSEYTLTNVASLAPRSRQRDLGIFANIYTVGCPLGTAAQATSGEITRANWEVDGEEYWMVSSPAYFGNSGGGVFHADTLELVGIFAKIYTHGTYRPQVITHMGLAIPISTIHDWLERAGYSELLPED